MSDEANTPGLGCGNGPAVHTITYDDNENKEHMAPSPEPFRFLSLPIEIRLRIYRYLAPNTPTSPFRDDGRPSCPSILRTNRTIYKEAIVEWYSFMPYDVYVSGQELRLSNLGITILPGEALPSMFQAIKSLDLTIRLEILPVLGQKYDSPRNTMLHQRLLTCFLPCSVGASNLQQLQVTLGVFLPFFLFYRCQPNLFRQALDSNVSALRNIHGLAKASVTIRFQAAIDKVYGLHYPTGPADLWKQEFMAILSAFSKDLEQSLSSGRCRHCILA
jgi:hypothetical protein